MTETIPKPKGDLEARLGARFRAVRTSHGLRLMDLVERLGAHINTIRWHEAGARMMRVDDLVRAAEAIGVSPADLINIDGDETSGHNENS